jgi:hypothetical protein
LGRHVPRERTESEDGGWASANFPSSQRDHQIPFVQASHPRQSARALLSKSRHRASTSFILVVLLRWFRFIVLTFGLLLVSTRMLAVRPEIFKPGRALARAEGGMSKNVTDTASICAGERKRAHPVVTGAVRLYTVSYFAASLLPFRFVLHFIHRARTARWMAATRNPSPTHPARRDSL